MKNNQKTYEKPFCGLIDFRNECVLCTSVGLDNINETQDVIVWDE